MCIKYVQKLREIEREKALTEWKQAKRGCDFIKKKKCWHLSFIKKKKRCWYTNNITGSFEGTNLIMFEFEQGILQYWTEYTENKVMTVCTGSIEDIICWKFCSSWFYLFDKFYELLSSL